jgi:hypothetical protein
MDRLGVPVLSPLDDQRHEQRRHHRESVPTEAVAVEHDPQYAVSRYDGKRPGARRDHSQVGQECPTNFCI